MQTGYAGRLVIGIGAREGYCQVGAWTGLQLQLHLHCQCKLCAWCHFCRALLSLMPLYLWVAYEKNSEQQSIKSNTNPVVLSCRIIILWSLSLSRNVNFPKYQILSISHSSRTFGCDMLHNWLNWRQPLLHVKSDMCAWGWLAAKVVLNTILYLPFPSSFFCNYWCSWSV